MSYVESVLERLKAQNPNEPEFHIKLLHRKNAFGF